VHIEEKVVSKGEVLNLLLAAGGGAAIRFKAGNKP